ncbi:hypothetical protein HQ945_08800 [Phyllobacterium sp. BT25]|uniref:Uncharacterized protein n=1 Tax=Phyllobacterium pellucidum TaxID=2740464 RepID=A0A849VNE5_9HYPH|nr:hypothetical protein [Phyllobacterium pellucidum]NTS31351.1 hypothetical protein [Phyllobacterium pellucidum]
MDRRKKSLIFYSSQDWSLMQTALLKASRELGRSPKGKLAERLARRVMTLFDQGMRDDEAIASAAAYQEKLIAQVMALRHQGATP